MINHFKGTCVDFLIMLLTGRNLSIANVIKYVDGCVSLGYVAPKLAMDV